MVACAGAFGDCWRERRVNDGTLTLFVSLFGGFGAVTGAVAYAFLMLRPTNGAWVTAIVEKTAWWAAGITGILYLLYRLPALRMSAADEAERKVAIEMMGTSQKGA
jgi:hypothetical protein